MSPSLPQPHNIYIVLYKIYIYIKNDIIYNKIPCNRSKYSIKSRNLRCAISENKPQIMITLMEKGRK